MNEEAKLNPEVDEDLESSTGGGPGARIGKFLLEHGEQVGGMSKLEAAATHADTLVHGTESMGRRGAMHAPHGPEQPFNAAAQAAADAARAGGRAASTGKKIAGGVIGTAGAIEGKNLFDDYEGQ